MRRQKKKKETGETCCLRESLEDVPRNTLTREDKPNKKREPLVDLPFDSKCIEDDKRQVTNESLFP